MSRFKVLISNPTIFQPAYELLSTICDVTISPGLDRASVLEVISGMDALCWSGRMRLDKEMLDVCGHQLKIVCTVSSGYNHVDLKELRERGIKFANTPKAMDNAVADTAILLALAAAKRATEGRRHIEKGTWTPTFDLRWMLGRDITGSTVGIIGLGGIGQAIARRLKGFDVEKILYTGHREKIEGRNLGGQFVNQDTLLKESDYVFLVAPFTNETAGMCDAIFFSKMKNNGIFINVSRGELVDQNALIKALKDGQIFGAGLDVMTPEPLSTNSELLKLSNVFLTQHIGSATLNTRMAMAELAARNILRGLAGEEMLTPVELSQSQ